MDEQTLSDAKDEVQAVVPETGTPRPVTGPTMQAKRRSIVDLLGFHRFSGLYGIALIFVVFAVWVPSTFVTVTTFRSLASEQSITAVVALGVILATAVGVFDLSVGGNLGFSIVLVAWLQSKEHHSALVAIALTLGCGLLIGLVNAFFVVFMRVSSFIATLGMGSVLSALAISLSNNQTISGGITSGFLRISGMRPLGIPVTLIYVLILAAIVWVVLERTPFGRYIRAIGGNQDATRLAGIGVERYIVATLATSGLVAAAAGVLYTSLVGAAPIGVGDTYLLPVFAAVFLGATQITPGRINVLGTLLAILLLSLGVKGLQLVGAPEWVAQTFNGAALIVSVALSNFRHRSLRTKIV